MLAHKNPYVGYRDFVLQGDNVDTDKFYGTEKRLILIKPKGRPKAECGSANGDVLLSAVWAIIRWCRSIRIFR